MNRNISPEDLQSLFVQDTPFIDVRAPIEFAQGHLPGAINFPILNDAERALIGTTYKQQGQDAAVKLGFQLISGPLKDERLQRWKDFVQVNPNTVLYCFRGGKRSQITQQWLKEAGVQRPLIAGGYKVARHFLMESITEFSQSHPMLVVSGPTGSGKTLLLQEVAGIYPALDLEGLARHRGSAFGNMSVPQPTQVNFENHLAVALLKIQAQGPGKYGPLVEDESRLIGRVHQPESFFEKLRVSQVLWVDEPLDARVANIFKDYILDSALGVHSGPMSRCAEEEQILFQQGLQVFEKYKNSVKAISRRLGGLRTQEVLTDLEVSEQDFIQKKEIASNKVWIEKLLRYYYDPLYLGSLERRQVQIRFRGTRQEVLDYIKNF